jgi:hypothetical protein
MAGSIGFETARHSAWSTLPLFVVNVLRRKECLSGDGCGVVTVTIADSGESCIRVFGLHCLIVCIAHQYGSVISVQLAGGAVFSDIKLEAVVPRKTV